MQPLNNTERGGVFFALFATVGMVAVMSGALGNLIRGPVTSSTNVSRANTAAAQMNMAVRLSAAASIEQAAGGDCDADGFSEPILPRAAGTAPAPVGGGLVPASIGSAQRDPWGTDFGYCVWDHGAATCGSGRRAGANSNAHASIAVVSAGPDKTFQTTCRDYLNASTVLIDKTQGSDDLIQSWTYAEMTGGGTAASDTIAVDYINSMNEPHIEIGAPVNVTGAVSVGGVEVIDEDGLIVHGEQDPKIGTVQENKFCTGNNLGHVNCLADAPAVLSCVNVSTGGNGGTTYLSRTATCAAGYIVTGGACSHTSSVPTEATQTISANSFSCMFAQTYASWGYTATARCCRVAAP